MPRFFIPSEQVRDGHAEILGADAVHLVKSLRVHPGEVVVVVVADQRIEHGVHVEAVSASRVAGTVMWSRPAEGEPRRRVLVIQAIPARGAELMVEALAEAGAAELLPVVTARGTARPSAERGRARVERWRSIARESAQLAGRAIVPVVHDVQPLAPAIRSVTGGARLLACVPAADAIPIGSIRLRDTQPVAIVIGPEGGFAGSDLELCRDAGAEFVHLGPRMLPAWLAGTIAVSLLLQSAGDLAQPAAEKPM